MSSPRPPKKFLVTRHRGAISWYAKTGQRASTIETTNFDPAIVRPGDVVIGTLPMQVAAQVCRAGGRYWHLAIDVPAEHRGRELSAEDMIAFGARLEEFKLDWLGTRVSLTPAVDLSYGGSADRPAIHICVATGETLANLLPAMCLPWVELVILETPEMKESADHLEEMIKRFFPAGSGQGSDRRVTRVPLPSPTTLALMDVEMQRAAAEIVARAPEHELVVNATGGYKFMTQALIDAFRPYSSIFYCHIQEDVLEAVWPRAPATWPLPKDLLTLEKALLANRSRIEDQAPLDEGTLAGVHERIHATATLALRAGTDGFTPKLIAFLHGEAQQAQVPGPGGSHQRIIDPRHVVRYRPRRGWETSLLVELNRIGLTEARSTEEFPFAFSFKSVEAAQYVGGGYLEEFALLCVEDLGVELPQMGWNVHVDSLYPIPDRPARKLNELDVALVWRNRLLVIECKAGMQLLWSDTSKPQDIINKLGMLRREKAGLFGSVWLLGRVPLKVPGDADVLQRMKESRIEGLNGRDALLSLPARLRAWCGSGDIRAATLDWASLQLR